MRNAPAGLEHPAEAFHFGKGGKIICPKTRYHGTVTGHRKVNINLAITVLSMLFFCLLLIEVFIILDFYELFEPQQKPWVAT